MATTTTPETRVNTILLRNTVLPTVVAERPNKMKTAEKPATNSAVSLATRPRCSRAPVCTSETSSPVTIDR
jgi:hypothetical protein